MRTFVCILVAVALGGCYATSREEERRGEERRGGEASFTLSLPAELPPLVVVQPGVSVARDMDHEIFYADGYYWARQDQTWFRARDHRGSWERVEPRYVPAALVQSPPGRYRHYRGDGDQRSDEEHGHDGHGGDRD
ncbi:hypothetical protein [Anaeromyxobacter oryzae]|uniref:Lipoprotein n=1 Tax=Anaeromyxobacter oryzae TaxID=2918170 RepID=A0ABN6MUV4_9BACT|nr:hypothetical protein [Anaeromyxobacter oryzae]BDG04759.1 hypothetical protein AMOR_37550 [Anaeromyxobacter oryzae]